MSILIELICFFISILSLFYLGWLYGYELGWEDKTKRKRHRLRYGFVKHAVRETEDKK